jgi:hypothetical protein
MASGNEWELGLYRESVADSPQVVFSDFGAGCGANLHLKKPCCVGHQTCSVSLDKQRSFGSRQRLMEI